MNSITKMKGIQNMKIGLVGLGTMGVNMGLNLIDNGYEVLGYDVLDEARTNARKKNVDVYDTQEEMVEALGDNKVVLTSIPSGDITDKVIGQLSELMNANDIIVDTGNSNYKDSLKNYDKLQKKSIHLLDCGTSGGMEGSRYGACLMVGGEEEVFNQVEEVFRAIAAENGYLYTGEPGSGHYVKMVHNGIEYGMMQAIGEGFEILNESDYDLNPEKLADVWSHGSVIRSWLMELTRDVFADDEDLEKIKGVIASSGTGKWTLEEALELKVPTPVISAAVNVRYQSEIADSYSARVVASLRHEFGGHEIVKK